jgi:CRISPR-associated protein Cmr6
MGAFTSSPPAALAYPIPKRSAAAFLAYKDQDRQNAGLIFSRFAPRVPDKDKDQVKRQGLEAARDAAKQGDSKLAEAWARRWRLGAAAIGATPFVATTDWRFVPGLGRKGSLEAGLTFHQYGFPYLPGSSVKGLARAWAALVEGLDEGYGDFLAIFGQIPDKENPNGGFGASAQSGGAVFLDAIPERAPKLDLDIMNPHYPKYYQGEAPPADNQSPVPIYFLTITPGTPFLFAVGWRGSHPDRDRLRALADGWLRSALQDLGAGAKTSAGYGYFTIGSEKVPAVPVADVKKTAAAAAVLAATPPPPQPAILNGEGKLKYDKKGRAYVEDSKDPNVSSQVDWTVLGNPDRPKGNTVVSYGYVMIDGRRSLMSLKKKG